MVITPPYAFIGKIIPRSQIYSYIRTVIFKIVPLLGTTGLGKSARNVRTRDVYKMAAGLTWRQRSTGHRQLRHQRHL